MINTYTIKKCTSWFLFALLLIALSNSIAFAQVSGFRFGLDSLKRDSIGVDTMTKDIMSVRNTYLNRGVDRWNTIIPRYKNIAGSHTIYGEDINTTPVDNITNVLSGRLPGLYTVQSSGRTGSMYDLSSLTLRGMTPIIVIDGVVRSFTSFNPDDIKSITVMSDALSTAMYGLRSSNGVVYITTKDRSEKKPFELNFTAQYGLLQVLKTPNLITGANYAGLFNEAQQNTFPGAAPAYSNAAIAAYQNGTNSPYTSPSNNYYDLIFKNNSAQQRYSIDAAGNGKTYRYYMSVENFSQTGNLITSDINPYNTNNDYNRYNVRTNLQIDFSDALELNVNIFGGFETYNEPGSSFSTLLSQMYTTSPFAYPIYNADGSFGGTPTFSNNVVASNISSGYINYNNRTVNVDVGLKYKFDNLVKGLWAKGFVSVNNYYLERYGRSKTFAVYSPNAVTPGTAQTYTSIGQNGTVSAGTGAASITSQLKQTNYSLTTGYDKQFGKNTLNITGVYNSDNILSSLTQLNAIFQSAGITASYDYNKKYFAEAALSYSGLNRYAPGNRWGVLPSVGLGWIVSNESWFKSKVFNYLKLKGTIGKTAWGDQANYYAYLQNYVAGTGYNFNASASTPVSGEKESTLANPDITWEKAWKWESGIETAFFNNRLNADVSYYYNNYYDQLQSPNNGYASGLIGESYPLVNERKSRYSGVEANIGFADKKGKLGYFIKGNLSVAGSKLTYANEGDYPYPWLYQTGNSVGQVTGYQVIGFYQPGDNFSVIPHIQGYTPQAGDVKYTDLNGDGVINPLDKKAITSNKPLILGGINLGASYRGFDISVLLQGVTNRQIYLDPGNMSAFNNSYGYVLDYTTQNRWTPQNTTNATLPRLSLGGNTNNQQTSSLWLRNGDYLRIKNLELGYTFQQSLLRHAKISNLRVFVNAYNLITWTRLDYFDPESLLSNFSNQRIINGGIKLSL
jgi:TonB-linked SusC/RagA family outer membrane protein